MTFRVCLNKIPSNRTSLTPKLNSLSHFVFHNLSQFFFFHYSCIRVTICLLPSMFVLLNWTGLTVRKYISSYKSKFKGKSDFKVVWPSKNQIIEWLLVCKIPLLIFCRRKRTGLQRLKIRKISLKDIWKPNLIFYRTTLGHKLTFELIIEKRDGISFCPAWPLLGIESRVKFPEV